MTTHTCLHHYTSLQFTGDGTKAEHVIYKIDIPANRYDLLCLEGITRAIRIFIGLEAPPVQQKGPVFIMYSVDALWAYGCLVLLLDTVLIVGLLYDIQNVLS